MVHLDSLDVLETLARGVTLRLNGTIQKIHTIPTYYVLPNND